MFDADVPDEDIRKALENLVNKYQDENYSFRIEHTGGGYQFLTKPAYQTSIGILLKQQSKKRLSNSALETLAIIAYKQPVTKTQIEHTGGGYQFLTKPAYQTSIGILLKQQSKKRLSNSALETLAIIAYKQPVTKTQIEQIRGVNCDYTTQKLLEKELIEIRGKADSLGRPILYGTSDKFMEYFGINDLKDLPSPKDFTREENSIGEGRIEE